LHIVKATR